MRESVPFVSIVMSVFNGEKYLAKSIDSVLNQTYMNYEFIIIDDGSVDSSREIVKSYNDKRIILIAQSNKGLAAALNAGIEKARGQFIARQDSGDVWFPAKLEQQVKYITTHGNIDVVGCASEIFDEREGPLLHEVVSIDPRIDSPFPHSSVVIRKSALDKSGGYDSRLRYAQDRDLWLRMFNGSNFFVFPVVLMAWSSPMATNIIGRLLHPKYAALIQQIAKAPSKRNELINNFNENIDEVEVKISQSLIDRNIDVDTWLKADYHKNWGSRYLKSGNSRNARRHFRNLCFLKLSNIWKIKYLLSFLPGTLVSQSMALWLYVRRKYLYKL